MGRSSKNQEDLLKENVMLTEAKEKKEGKRDECLKVVLDSYRRKYSCFFHFKNGKPEPNNEVWRRKWTEDSDQFLQWYWRKERSESRLISYIVL